MAAIDTDYARMMLGHHEQALELSAMVPGRSSSPDVADLAFRIDRAQVEEVGQLQGFLRLRGAPTEPGPGMSGMAGMADAATLARLRALSGPAFDRLWLQTMTAHHEGALAMARQQLAQTGGAASTSAARRVLPHAAGEPAGRDRPDARAARRALTSHDLHGTASAQGPAAPGWARAWGRGGVIEQTGGNRAGPHDDSTHVRRVGEAARRGAAAVVVALLCALFGLVTALPASAHAMLERTSPGADSVVARTPDQVSVTFSEAVTLVPGAVRVYDGGLREVDAGTASHPGGDPTSAGVALAPGLAPGTYTVTWRVVSADSHPVSGGFRFSIGHPGPSAAPPPPETGGGAAGVLLAVARFVEYAGLAVLGGAVVLVALRRAGAEVTTLRRARRSVVVGWWALLVGSVLALILQGPDAAGVGIGDAFDPTVLATTIASPTGLFLAARVVLVAFAGLVGRRLVAPTGAASPTGERAVVTAVALVAAAATFSASGHAGVDPPVVLGMVVDLAHLTAMSLWIGGLVVLLAALHRAGEPTAVAAVLPRFSQAAQVAVAVIVATGLYQTWRDVGEIGALVTTTYGWLLIAKVGGVVVLLALGDRARRLVARRLVARAGSGAGAGPAPLRALAGSGLVVRPRRGCKHRCRCKHRPIGVLP